MGDCILTIAYLINRMPSKIFQDKTPHKLLFKMIHFYYHLKVSGCLFYGHNPNIRCKLDARALPGIFVAYSFAQKEIFYLYFNKIYISRDATFFNILFFKI